MHGDSPQLLYFRAASVCSLKPKNEIVMKKLISSIVPGFLGIFCLAMSALMLTGLVEEGASFVKLIVDSILMLGLLLMPIMGTLLYLGLTLLMFITVKDIWTEES